MNKFDIFGNFLPLAAAISLIGGAINAGFEAYNSYSSGGSPGDILSAAATGFIAGTAGTAAGLLTRNPYASGAVSGATTEAVDQLLGGDGDWTDIVSSGLFGAAGGKLGSKVYPLKGRRPSLTKPRKFKEYDPDSQRLLKQATVGNVVGSALNNLLGGNDPSNSSDNCIPIPQQKPEPLYPQPPWGDYAYPYGYA